MVFMGAVLAVGGAEAEAGSMQALSLTQAPVVPRRAHPPSSLRRPRWGLPVRAAAASERGVATPTFRTRWQAMGGLQARATTLLQQHLGRVAARSERAAVGA